MSVGALAIFRNLSFLTVGRVVGDLAAFALFIAISRTYGQEGTGHYSFGMALTSFIAVTADFGLIYFAVRELSRNTEDIIGRFSLMQSARLTLVVPITAVFVLIIAALDVPAETKQVAAVLAVYHVIYTFVGGAISLFVSQEDMRTAGLAEFAGRGGAALVGLPILAGGGSLTTALIGFPLASAIVGVVLHVAIARRWGRVRYVLPFGENAEKIRGLVRRSASFGFMELLQHIATRIDVIFLGILVGAAATGIYNTAYRLVVFPQLLAYFAAVSLLPHASRLGVSDPAALRGFYRDALNTTVLLTLPAAVGLGLIASDLVPFIFSDAFTESGLVLRVLACLVFLSITKQVVGVFLMATDRQRQNFNVQALAALVNAGGNLVLIPRYGPMGAAWASIGAEFLAIVLLAHALRRDFGWPPIAGRFAAAAAGSAAFLVAAEFVPALPWPALIPMSIGIYALVVLSMPGIRRREGAVLRTWLRPSL